MKTSTWGTVLGALALLGLGLLYFLVNGLANETHDRSRRRASGPPAELGPRIQRETGVPHAPPRMDGARGRERGLGQRSVRPEVESCRPLDPEGLISSIDELATVLRLTPAQKKQVAEIVVRGRRRVEDVLKIPDGKGTSPFDRSEAWNAKLTRAIESKNSPAIARLGCDVLEDCRVIPGRSTTYRDEIDRVKEETRSEIAKVLEEEQGSRFKQTDINPMLGGNGGSFVVTASGIAGSAVVGPFDGEGGD